MIKINITHLYIHVVISILKFPTILYSIYNPISNQLKFTKKENFYATSCNTLEPVFFMEFMEHTAIHWNTPEYTVFFMEYTGTHQIYHGIHGNTSYS